MQNIIFERPKLNAPTPEENLAIVDTWIADTVDKLNYIFGGCNGENQNQ